jgi:hypothetical protein
MKATTIHRPLFAFLIFVLGSLQAWDSNVPSAGLMIVLLVSIAIALPAVVLQSSLNQAQFIAALGPSLILLLIARLVSPVPLPGLFIIMVPAAIGLIGASVLLQPRIIKN